MFWPPLVRLLLFILTWERLELILTICIPSAVIWVDIVRNLVTYWLIVRFDDHGIKPKWKRRHRSKTWKQCEGIVCAVGKYTIRMLDKAVTWTIGSEPTKREMMTWRDQSVNYQQRVRKGRSSGKGHCKRRLRTSEWYKTASIICLIARVGNSHATRFDSDSVTLHIDNCASRCITHSIDDFASPPQKVIGRVKGMGGDNVAVAAVGTIKWTIDDDTGTPHTFLIPRSLYIPESPARLFSPQHWAQEQKDDLPVKNGSWQATYADHVTLVWGQQQYRKTIDFDKSNVATFSTSPGCKHYRAFCACVDSMEHHKVDNSNNKGEFTAFDATLIIDDEDDDPPSDVSGEPSDDESITPIQRPEAGRVHQRDADDDIGYTKATGHHETSYETYNKDVATIENVEEDSFNGKLPPTAELLLWHYRHGHVPFSRLQAMAKEGSLPRRLRDCRVPKCASCMYGKMTRRAKRAKNEKSGIDARIITGPGACVSVDQLESRTMGLIGHMKGNPTVQRYRCATIYIDHYSRLSYVHLQKQLTSEETVQGKIAFEKFCEARGVTVRHYHADNGRFADKGFVNHVVSNRQSISYCGVNAHFQNGMAEKRIRDLQDQTTTMLMHAEGKWPDVITSNLWPYALREANESLNSTPSKVTGKVANQMFARTDSPTVLRHFHPFGCPTYILNDELAAGKSIPKWHKRARLGVYLGRSPNHAQSVALVLSLATGLVSPQFHLKFDDLFETVKGETTYPNRWKAATHFRKESKHDRHPVRPSRPITNTNNEGNQTDDQREDVTKGQGGMDLIPESD